MCSNIQCDLFFLPLRGLQVVSCDQGLYRFCKPCIAISVHAPAPAPLSRWHGSGDARANSVHGTHRTHVLWLSTPSSRGTRRAQPSGRLLLLGAKPVRRSALVSPAVNRHTDWSARTSSCTFKGGHRGSNKSNHHALLTYNLVNYCRST